MNILFSVSSQYNVCNARIPDAKILLKRTAQHRLMQFQWLQRYFGIICTVSPKRTIFSILL